MIPIIVKWWFHEKVVLYLNRSLGKYAKFCVFSIDLIRYQKRSRTSESVEEQERIVLISDKSLYKKERYPTRTATYMQSEQIITRVAKFLVVVYVFQPNKDQCTNGVRTGI